MERLPRHWWALWAEPTSTAAAARLPRPELRNLAIRWPILRLLLSALIRALAAFTPKISVIHPTALKHSAGASRLRRNTVNFTSGLYIIDGGGITIDGGATVSGTGVTFYLTGDNGNGSNATNYSGVTINGNATVNLSSPCDPSGQRHCRDAVFSGPLNHEWERQAQSTAASGSTFNGAHLFPDDSSRVRREHPAVTWFTLLIVRHAQPSWQFHVGNNLHLVSPTAR